MLGGVNHGGAGGRQAGGGRQGRGREGKPGGNGSELSKQLTRWPD